MGFFSKLFGGAPSEPGRFQTEAAYTKNRARQLTMTPQTMTQLRKYGVTPASQLKLEYFFYTNTPEKAATLAQHLASLGYTGDHGRSASGKKQYVITGWTPRLPMDDQSVLAWTALMCDTGHEHDCEFDGWGTNPQQP
jgi:hypothetical protein